MDTMKLKSFPSSFKMVTVQFSHKWILGISIVVTVLGSGLAQIIGALPTKVGR